MSSFLSLLIVINFERNFFRLMNLRKILILFIPKFIIIIILRTFNLYLDFFHHLLLIMIFLYFNLNFIRIFMIIMIKLIMIKMKKLSILNFKDFLNFFCNLNFNFMFVIFLNFIKILLTKIFLYFYF